MTQEIGYACVVARKFTNDASVSFQLNFPVGADPAVINAELDKIGAVMERQQDKIDLSGLGHQLEQQRINLKKQGEMIAELNSKIEAPDDIRLRQGNKTQLKSQLDNAITTYKATEDGIKRAEAVLEDLKKKAA